MVLCLSIRMPWAWAILHAGKDIENRSWPTKVRGRVLIHAAKGMTRNEYVDFIDTCHDINRTHPFPSDLVVPAFAHFTCGGIVGSVDIVGCVQKSNSPWFFGKYGFVLRNPKPMPFIPYKGSLGFFEVDNGLIEGAL